MQGLAAMIRLGWILLAAGTLWGQSAADVFGRLNGVRWEGPLAKECTARVPVQMDIYATVEWTHHCTDTRDGVIRETFFYVFGEPARIALLRADVRAVDESPGNTARLLPALQKELDRAVWRADSRSGNDGDRVSSLALRPTDRGRSLEGRRAALLPACQPERFDSDGRAPRRTTGRHHRPAVRRAHAGCIDPAGRRNFRRGSRRRQSGPRTPEGADRSALRARHASQPETGRRERNHAGSDHHPARIGSRRRAAAGVRLAGRRSGGEQAQPVADREFARRARSAVRPAAVGGVTARSSAV